MNQNVHLEIVNTDTEGRTLIKGETIPVIFAWMQLSAAVAETVKIPLPALLAKCAVLGKQVEALNRYSEDYRIDLSHPVEPAPPNNPA